MSVRLLSPGEISRRAVWDLVIAFAVGIVLAVLVLVYNFNVLFGTAPALEHLPHVRFLTNFLIVWLAALLLVAFLRWRDAFASSRDLHGIVNSISPDALVVVRPDRTIVACNNSVERVFGHSPADVVGSKTESLYYDRRTECQFPDEIYSTLQKEGYHVGTARGMRKDGTRIDLEIVSAVLPRQRGAVLLMRDITDRLRGEEQRRALTARMEQRQKLESLGILAEGMAHDFNNLLMIIEGNSDMAIDNLKHGSKEYAAVLEIQAATHNAAQLCRHMLAYAGKGRIHVEPLDVGRLIESIMPLIKATISNKAKVQTHLPWGLPHVSGDTAQLRQAVLNLAANASDALEGEAGTINVATSVRFCSVEDLARTYMQDDLPGGNYVVIEVTDTGSGIPNELIPEICDPFFTTRYKGRGLGLAAVLGIVRGHRGAFEVSSAVGEGTTVRVFLPTVDPTGVCSESEIESNAEDWVGSGLVLLAEDDPAVRLVTRSILEKIGFDVLTASDGQTALEVFKERAMDIALVMLDLTMPRLDGIETFVRLREIRPDVKVVLASGYGAESVDTDPRLEGLAGFIEKPYKLSRLRLELMRILDGDDEVMDR